MRAYFFVNMYLSSIQNGIQSAHCLHELFLRYNNINKEPDSYLWNWANNHKTMIVLNGGYSENLYQLFDLFSTFENPYPFAKFHEGQDALDGALTCVGIILPSKIYQLASELRGPSKNHHLSLIRDTGIWVDNSHNMNNISRFELALAQELTKYSLAS